MLWGERPGLKEATGSSNWSISSLGTFGGMVEGKVEGRGLSSGRVVREEKYQMRTITKSCL